MVKIFKLGAILLYISSLEAYAGSPTETQTSQNYLQFRTRNGDSLGSILSHLGQCPVWGERGSAGRTIQINPQLQMARPYAKMSIAAEVRRGDWLLPNQLINLPFHTIPSRVNTHARINSEGLLEMIPEAPVISCRIEKANTVVNESSTNSSEESEPKAAVQLKPAVSEALQNEETLATSNKANLESSTPVLTKPSFEMQVLPRPLQYYYGADFGIHYFLLDQTNVPPGSKLSVLSDASPRLAIESGIVLNQMNSVLMRFWVERFSLGSLDTKNSFSNGSGYLTGFGFFYDRRITEIWSLGTGVSFDQDLFFDTASTSTELRYNSVLIAKPGVQTRAKLSLAQSISFGFDADIAVAVPVSASVYSISTGWQLGTDVFFQYQPKSNSNRENYANSTGDTVELKLGLMRESQNTSFANRSVTDVNIGLGYRRSVSW